MGLVERWVATRQGFKPRDVEEFVDYYWHRPLAGLLVQVIESWPVTPNQVTLASGFAGALSGIAIGYAAIYGPTWWATVGGALLLLSIVFDCADGQLARIKGISSMVGRALDGTMDIVAPLFVFHGLVFYLLWVAGHPHWVVWPCAVAVSSSLLWHVNQYDLAKNIYLHASRPDFSLGGDTLLMPEKMRAMQEQFAKNGETISSTVMRIWIFWTGPQVKQLRPWLEIERSPQNDAERDLFRELFTPLMHRLTWLGFGTHLFLLTLGALFAPLDSRAIWIGWAIIFGPLNIIAVWYAIVRPRREREFVRRLAEMREPAVAEEP